MEGGYFMTAYMLTTVDNPYNPFTDFDNWYAYDTQMGYNTSAYLSRIAKTSEYLTDDENDQAVDDAINEILYFDVLGTYQKVSRENFDEMKSRPLTQDNKESLEMMDLIPKDLTVEEQ